MISKHTDYPKLTVIKINERNDILLKKYKFQNAITKYIKLTFVIQKIEERTTKVKKMLETFPKNETKIRKYCNLLLSSLKIENRNLKNKGTFNTIFRGNNETFPEEIYLPSKSSL